MIDVKSKNYSKSSRRKKSSITIGLFLAAALFFLIYGTVGILSFSDKDDDGDANRNDGIAPKAEAHSANDTFGTDWAGPILYRYPEGRPVHVILVEKSSQKLSLYRYDGKYRLIETYTCSTGEKHGKKRRESDEKTPEGIFFNDRTFRDRKVTVFGDRAFGLTYPDPIDHLDGNRGGGIFIHGTNRDVKPYSSNGCVVLDNADIAELDRKVELKNTPVIIGDQLPYTFDSPNGAVDELIPFFKKAMLPEKYAGMEAEYDELTVLRFEDRVVVTGNVRVKSGDIVQGVSRLYLSGPGKRLLVLVKREWSREKILTAQAGKKEPVSAASASVAKKEPEKKPAVADNAIAEMVASWRNAWQGKRIDAYISHYHPGFANKGKDLGQWKEYKGRLNKKYKKISVRISNLRVKINGERASAYFRQAYRSDTFHSNAYKILELRKSAGQWKIYREKSYSNKPSGWPS